MESYRFLESLFDFNTPTKRQSQQKDINEKSSYAKKRQLGRWGLQECQRYLQVIKECDEKDVIRALRKAMPNRLQSQIRAHHSKMMKKYCTLDRIIEVSSRSENRVLIQINKILRICASDLTHVDNQFEEMKGNEKQQAD